MAQNSVVIRSEGLTKQYKEVTAVHNLSFQVHQGEIFGLLGPNGAGKTTTISMLLGLIRPTAGYAEIMGCDVRKESTTALRQVGALVEAAFYPYLSATDNLWVMAQMSGGGIPPERIRAVLAQVGLAGRAQSKVQTFSMGMKQRLGLAAALVHNPQLLILDEPTNGLDPAGMLEMRQLLGQLATQEGKTIILSSHLLYEVEQVCDRVLILRRGEAIAHGRVSELLAHGGHIEIKIAQAGAAINVLQTLDWVKAVQLRDDGVILVDAPGERAAEITAALAHHQLYLHGLKVTERSLESYFLDIIRDNGD
jgi:ABC-2 type transport system ATP-binding protein